MDEKQLIEKLRLVEALFEGTSSEGERQAAANALERIRSRLEQLRLRVITEMRIAPGRGGSSREATAPVPPPSVRRSDRWHADTQRR